MDRDKLYNRASDLIEQNKLAEAIDVLDKLIDKHPNYLEAINLLANCYIELNHYAHAIKILLHAEKIQPRSPEIKYNLGYALLCNGRLNDAVRYFEKSLELNPSVEVKKMVNNMIKTKEEFEKKLTNNYPISLEEEFECQDLFLKAQQLLYSGNEEKAIELYSKIIVKKPNHPETMHNIGTAYIKLKQYEKALKFFENSNKKDMLHIISMIDINHKMGDNLKKEEYLKRINASHEKPLLRDAVRIVSSLIDIDEDKTAKKLLIRFRHHTPHQQLDFLYAIILAKEGKYDDAGSIFLYLSEFSDLCFEYFEATDKLSKKKIKNYHFKPLLIVPDISLL
ncbi:MAG: tetratricopeptide repeat protein [Nanoarchaeota archaeon]|nr:tetratricopeptide repeat protein [Nanoarchaeota archaeon]